MTLELNHKFIAAHHQPAVILDVMLALSNADSSEKESHKLLAGTGLFLEDIIQGESQINALQLNKILANSRRLYPSSDLSFMIGKRLLPGYFPQYSNLLRQSRNLRQLLSNVCRYYQVFSPLLYPHIEETNNYCYVRWSSSFSSSEDSVFLAEMMQAGLASMCKRLDQQPMPWGFHFKHKQPGYAEQYWVHLNSDDIQFSSCADMMVIPKHYMDRTFQDYSETSYQVALHNLNKNEPNNHCPLPFLTALQRYITTHLSRSITLESAAEHFHCSASTFKRRLNKHNTSFQQQLDAIRHHQATKLISELGWNNQQVAEYLNFSDSKNFRRAFKRWNGSTPTGLRIKYPALL